MYAKAFGSIGKAGMGIRIISCFAKKVPVISFVTLYRFTFIICFLPLYCLPLYCLPLYRGVRNTIFTFVTRAGNLKKEE